MRVLAFTRYGRRAASTRQRVLQYEPALREAGITLTSQALLGDDYVDSLAGHGGFSRAGVAAAYLQRLRMLARPHADLIWIYGELFPYLPGSLETRVFEAGLPVVYDFDDAFFHTYDQSGSALVRRVLGRKFEPLLRRVTGCSAGNPYLQDYARRFCPNTMLLPTVVDTDQYRPATKPNDAPLVIGWIGSPSTWRYLRPLLPLLSELAKEHDAEIHVVGAGAQASAEDMPRLRLRDWTEEREIADVQAMDIGIMPLPDEVWARGKSGYKLIQYMACGLPVVAAPVGVNTAIVEHDRTGLLAEDAQQWRVALQRLLGDAALRRSMGAAGRERAERLYSLRTHAPRLVAFLRAAAATRTRPV